MNNCNKILFFILLPFLLISSSNFAMITSLTKKRTIFGKKLNAIDQLTSISSIDEEINKIKKNIYRQYIQEIKRITNDHDDDWDKEISTKRACARKALQSKNLDNHQIHSHNFPPDIYKDIITTMDQENINPNIIELYYDSTPNDPSLYASAYSGAIFPPHATYIIRPSITIYKALLKQTRNEQLFTYTHELQHVILGHSSPRVFLPYSKRLISLQEREADLHAASKNIHLAYAGMISTCTGYHPDIIHHEQHSDDMFMIYALLHKKESLLQKNVAE